MSKTENRLLQSAREALAYAEGRADNKNYEVRELPRFDVREVRRQTKLSQMGFAERYHFSVGRIRDWEQGRANVDIPLRLLLTLIKKNPQAVEQALAEVEAGL